MSLPTQTQMNGIVLCYVADKRMRTRKEILEGVEAELHLSPEERARMTSSGVRTVQSRASWSVSNLNALGLMESSTRNAWRISEQGRALVTACGGDTAKVSEQCRALLNQLNAGRGAKGALGVPGQMRDGQASGAASVASVAPVVGVPLSGGEGVQSKGTPVPHEDKSPQELIEYAMAELNDALAAELLARVLASGPEFFERLVVDVLTKMGYGTGKTTSYAHDGGIDGIIDMDALGLDQIYVQAKCYAADNVVGRPILQSFAGAMNKVSRGVFITTSRFSREAIEYAKSYSNATIVLVDGQELARLMIRYGVGVNVERAYEVKRLDSDYFS